MPPLSAPNEPESPSPTGAAASAPRRWEYLAILCLLAASLMIFQIAVLRELRFQLTTLFTLTPFLFSSVIAFVGFGSLAASRITVGSHTTLRRTTLVLPLILLPMFALTIAVAQATVDHASPSLAYYGPPLAVSGDRYLDSVVVAFLLVALLGYGGIFFLQGLTFALYFREGRREGTLSSVYAVDLMSSGFGAILGGLLSFFLTPAELVIVASTMLLLNLWISFGYLKIPRILVVCETLALVGMFAVERTAGLVDRLESPRWLGAIPVYSKWSPYRRIDVMDAPSSLHVYTDGLLFHMNHKSTRGLLETKRAWPVRLVSQRKDSLRDVLVIGTGSGEDIQVFRSLLPRSLNIVAVELDHGFVDAARRFPWLWSHYRTAEIVVEEGRYFLENTDRFFDMIVYSYIDPQSAISDIGLPDANFLYTDAGLRSAYRRLRPGGLLVMTRVFFADQQKEFLSRLCATLERAGISPSDSRIYVEEAKFAWGYYGVLSTASFVAQKGGAPPALPETWLAPVGCVGGGRPTTDLFPLSLVTTVWFEGLVQYASRKPVAIAAVALLLLGVVGRLATSLGHLNFFLLGFGSFLLESLVLYNSFLLIGNPSLSTAIAVGVFLIWNAVGSLFSERLERVRGFYPLVPAAVLGYSATAPWLNVYTIAWPVALRSLAFVLHLSVAGVAVGAMFPIALRSFRQEHVASMFFIDLVGCALAPVGFWVAMSVHGVLPVALGSVLSYAVVALMLALRR